MELTSISAMMPRRRRLLTLASLIAVPSYVLPVGFWGLRGLRPRLLRDAASGAIALGVLSIAGWGVSHLIVRRRIALSARHTPPARHTRPPEGQRWKLPINGPIMAEEMLGSAASGH